MFGIATLNSGLSIDTLSEQKFGRRIDGEAEEQRPKVQGGGPTRRIALKMSHQLTNVVFLKLKVSNLISSKLRTE